MSFHFFRENLLKKNLKDPGVALGLKVHDNMLRYFALALLGLILAGCATGPQEPEIRLPDGSVTKAPKRATSKPYQIKGVWYYPQEHYEYEEHGVASYYGGGDVFHGRPTATGERFDMNGVTAAHKTLPLPCIAEVTNLENGRKIVVKVNDRGPFVNDRIIDVSRRVAQLLGFENQGTAKVRVKTLVEDSMSLNSLEASKVVLDETVVETPIAAPTNKIAVGTLAPLGAVAVSTKALADTPKKAIATAPKPKKEFIADADVLPDILPDDFFKSVEPNAVALMETKPLIPKELPPPPPSLKAVAKPAPEPKPGGGRGIYVDVGEYPQNEANQVAKKLQTLAKGLYTDLTQSGQNMVVRLGPLQSAKDADLLLDHLVEAGYHKAKMIFRN
ncbi:septal ring lytic transglycosylase RlpA family protein [Candidatus Bealeia paramacronuclearis]|uniref:septal ring lytic transglycosylase RlpA family protein n=1 Tax=Candidatus Bealeia paramacronuclearis TaxID=1921001 RepID=UPI0030D4714F